MISKWICLGSYGFLIFSFWAVLIGRYFIGRKIISDYKMFFGAGTTEAWKALSNTVIASIRERKQLHFIWREREALPLDLKMLLTLYRKTTWILVGILLFGGFVVFEAHKLCA